jgi:hypothetical protein
MEFFLRLILLSSFSSVRIIIIVLPSTSAIENYNNIRARFANAIETREQPLLFVKRPRVRLNQLTFPLAIADEQMLGPASKGFCSCGSHARFKCKFVPVNFIIAGKLIWATNSERIK